MARAAVIPLADRVEAVRRPHPVRVAIDGVDAAGKTTLADELAADLRRRGREVVRASMDDVHRPRAERYRRGELSPDGYYHDSFDYDALRETMLGPGRVHEEAERRYRRRNQPGSGSTSQRRGRSRRQTWPSRTAIRRGQDSEQAELHRPLGDDPKQRL